MQLKDRINEAMKAAKLSPAGLARATKSTNAAINFWLTGKTKSLKAEKAAMIETATGYCAQWVISGKGKKLLDDMENISNQPVALIDKAQAATNNIAIDVALKVLSAALEQANPALRDALAGMLSSLAKTPAQPELLEALTKMLSHAAFVQDQKKVA